MNIPTIEIGHLPPDPVGPQDEALPTVKRQQTNASRWNGDQWPDFVAALKRADVDIREDKATTSVFITDAGGMTYSLPHGVVRAQSAEQISRLLKTAQEYKVPVTVRGGGLTTEGESVAHGGVLLDMSSLSDVIEIDKEALTVRTQAGIFFHSLAEILRREGLDYISAPLNLTPSVGGTIGVGGIDVNSAKHGCTADQVISMQVVTPTGEIVECSDDFNPDLFERVILGYGQFGVITEVTLKIRPYNPIKMHYFYYKSLRSAIEDLQMLDYHQVCDYTGILTMMDRAVNLLVAFETVEREIEFMDTWRKRLSGHGEVGFAVQMGLHYALRPWKIKEALYLLNRKRTMFPEFHRSEYMREDLLHDRSVIYSRAVWRFWGERQMVIPDLATSSEKFAEAVERGNAVCKKYFSRYTLYCVGIKLRPEHKNHYELSCIPPDAEGWGYGCEFEPMFEGKLYSRDYLQSFKNEIYDIGIDLGGSYYRFGGVMKGYIRRMFGDEVVDKHLALKRAADPAMILNKDVIF